MQIKLWIFAVSVLLIILANANLIQITSDWYLSANVDPVFPFMSFQLSHLCAATLEFGVGLLGVFYKNQRLQGVAIFTTGAIFAGYRLTYFYFGIKKPCDCLGVLQSVFKLRHETAEMLTLVLIFALLIIGLLTLLDIHKLKFRK